MVRKFGVCNIDNFLDDTDTEALGEEGVHDCQTEDPRVPGGTDYLRKVRSDPVSVRKVLPSRPDYQALSVWDPEDPFRVRSIFPEAEISVSVS